MLIYLIELALDIRKGGRAVVAGKAEGLLGGKGQVPGGGATIRYRFAAVQAGVLFVAVAAVAGGVCRVFTVDGGTIDIRAMAGVKIGSGQSQPGKGKKNPAEARYYKKGDEKFFRAFHG